MHSKNIFKVLYVDLQVTLDVAFHIIMKYVLFTFLVMVIHFLFTITIIILLIIAFSHNYYQHTLLNNTEICYFCAHSITECRDVRG